MRKILFTICLSLISITAFAKPKAKSGDQAAIEYTGKLADTKIFDSNVGKKPIEFEIGKHALLPKFEEAVLGMKLNQTKTFVIKAADAYGEYKPEKIIKVPKEKLPENAKPGDSLTVQSPSGNFPVTFVELKENDAYIDTNHVLAGKDLTFDIKLVGLVPAKKHKQAKQEPEAAKNPTVEPKSEPTESPSK